MFAVDVVGIRVACLDARFDEGVVERAGPGALHDMDRAGTATPAGLAFLPCLEAPEVGEHLAPRPAVSALLHPALEVQRMAADEAQAVDGGRPAQHLAPWLDDGAVVHGGFGLAFEHPVECGILPGSAERRRHLDLPVAEDRASGGSCLEQENADGGIFREPCGQRAPGAAGTQDDVVVFPRCRHERSPDTLPMTAFLPGHGAVAPPAMASPPPARVKTR